ncbi:hypothetical protein ACFXJ8_11770 [Nonomuraea sp. NPDC059194]|uniref:hypothetical protein n=1 Tax=Nonomuraea sp. NPDC059194 TaxID=3346764 RepID=UPI0036B6316B
MTEPTTPADAEEAPAETPPYIGLLDLMLWMIPGRSVGISLPPTHRYVGTWTDRQ